MIERKIQRIFSRAGKYTYDDTKYARLPSYLPGTYSILSQPYNSIKHIYILFYLNLVQNDRLYKRYGINQMSTLNSVVYVRTTITIILKRIYFLLFLNYGIELKKATFKEASPVFPFCDISL